MGGEQQGGIESSTERVWRFNRKEAHVCKETWWWNDEVKDAIRATKDAKKSGNPQKGREDKHSYRKSHKEARKEVATSKVQAMK